MLNFRWPKGIGFLIPGVFFITVGLLIWTWTINSAAFLLGYGEKITVIVEKDSTGWRSSSLGAGYFYRDNKQVPVRIYGVIRGTEVSARLPIIELGMEHKMDAFYGRSYAIRQLITTPIGGLIMFSIGLVFTFAGIQNISYFENFTSRYELWKGSLSGILYQLLKKR